MGGGNKEEAMRVHVQSERQGDCVIGVCVCARGRRKDDEESLILDFLAFLRKVFFGDD